MQSPVYDPINGDVGAMFPPNRSGVLPPTKPGGVLDLTQGMNGGFIKPSDLRGGIAPIPGAAAPMDDMQRQALVKALSAKIGAIPPQTGVA